MSVVSNLKIRSNKMGRLIGLILGLILGLLFACGTDINLSEDAIEFDQEPTHLKVIPGKASVNISSIEMAGQHLFGKRHLRKRQTETLNIRIFVVVDYILYKRYLGLENDDEANAIDQIRYFYAHVINSVNDKYTSIDTGAYRYKVVLTGYYVAQTESASTFTEHQDVKTDNPAVVKYGAVLGQLQKWATANTDIVKDFTTIAAFTLYKDKAAIGMAYVSLACTKGGVSINLSAGLYATANVVAHEVGHTLSSGHDGVGNDCKAEDKFLMTAIMGPNGKNNYNTFSNCSRSFFEKYIGNLKSDVKNVCFKDETNPLDEEIKKYLELLPGQKYTPDETCKQIFGNGSFYCTPGAKANQEICRKLNCWVPKDGGGACYNSIESRGMDGTSCGNRMWCINTTCVSDDRAPEKDEFCMYGETKEPIMFNNVKYKCSDFNNQPAMCYYEFVREYCCETCTKIKEGFSNITNCEYGDRQQRLNYNNKIITCEDFKTENGYCYIESFRRVCCKTCYDIAQTHNPDCPYGDKMYQMIYYWDVIGCPDFKKYPQLCNDAARKKACCKTCNELVKFGNNTECPLGDCESVEI